MWENLSSMIARPFSMINLLRKMLRLRESLQKMLVLRHLKVSKASLFLRKEQRKSLSSTTKLRWMNLIEETNLSIESQLVTDLTILVIATINLQLKAEANQWNHTSLHWSQSSHLEFLYLRCLRLKPLSSSRRTIEDSVLWKTSS